MKLKVNLKPLRQVIIQEFNSIKSATSDTFGLIYTCVLIVFFFIAGILGILNYFFIKALLFLALALLLVYCILVMYKNKNHPE